MTSSTDAFVNRFTIKPTQSGPLDGLHFVAKDIYDVAGHVTGCGNPEWARTHEAASSHAPAVAMLLSAGATLDGKTHTDELAYSLMGVNAHYGTPLNTAAPDRVPGGSSSGSVSAVAAGETDVGLGSDTGGSVRMPASFCGVFGIRTTHGRIPIDHAMALAPSYDTVGWFTRDAATLARAGRAFGISPGGEAKGLMLPVDTWALASQATVDQMAPLLAKLQNLIGPARPVVLADAGLDQWREAFRIHQAREVWDVHGAWVESNSPNFGPGIMDRFLMAKSITDDAFEWARTTRRAIAARMHGLLDHGAVMVLPTSPGPAPHLGSGQEEQNIFRTRALEMLCPAGHAGLPQVSVPSGSVDGGPVGLSLIGSAGGEEMLLSIACEID